jgi:four helix bundle protein
MRTKTYRDLLFWKSAFEVSKLCIKLIRKLPRESVAKVIIYQLLRSSGSVGANIAEGYGRFGTKEYPRFLQMALGSANETEYWLLLLKDSYSQFEKEINLILNKNLETIKMLTSSINKLRKKS